MHGAYCAFIERDFYCHQGTTMGEDMPGNALSTFSFTVLLCNTNINSSLV